jgi:hypothetical protein
MRGLFANARAARAHASASMKRGVASMSRIAMRSQKT